MHSLTVHRHTVSRVLVVIATLAHAAALLLAQRPFSLIKISAPPGASTTHNLVAHYLPPTELWEGFTVISSQEESNAAMTAAVGHSNLPSLSVESPHFSYSGFWLLLVSGSQVLKHQAKGQRDLPGRRSDSSTSAVKGVGQALRQQAKSCA